MANPAFKSAAWAAQAEKQAGKYRYIPTEDLAKNRQQGVVGPGAAAPVGPGTGYSDPDMYADPEAYADPDGYNKLAPASRVAGPAATGYNRLGAAEQQSYSKLGANPGSDSPQQAYNKLGASPDSYAHLPKAKTAPASASTYNTLGAVAPAAQTDYTPMAPAVTPAAAPSTYDKLGAPAAQTDYTPMAPAVTPAVTPATAPSTYAQLDAPAAPTAAPGYDPSAAYDQFEFSGFEDSGAAPGGQAVYDAMQVSAPAAEPIQEAYDTMDAPTKQLQPDTGDVVYGDVDSDDDKDGYLDVGSEEA